MQASLTRGYASENGTELNEIIPKMSPLNPQYLTKKQRVFQSIAAFVDKYKGVGGHVNGKTEWKAEAGVSLNNLENS